MASEHPLEIVFGAKMQAQSTTDVPLPASTQSPQDLVNQSAVTGLIPVNAVKESERTAALDAARTLGIAPEMIQFNITEPQPLPSNVIPLPAQPSAPSQNGFFSLDAAVADSVKKAA